MIRLSCADQPLAGVEFSRRRRRRVDWYVLAMVESSVRSVDGTDIRFTDSGGDGPVVILLHGATMTSISNFETRFGTGDDGRRGPVAGPTVVSTLRDAGARVVCVDARGHGRSGRSADASRYSGASNARDVQAVIDELDAGDVDVVGYSMGAMTAARLLGIESRLRSVALCGTGPTHVEGHGDALFTDIHAMGRCFQADDWSNHPEYKPYRAFARLDPVHDFASIGAALIALDAVPMESLKRAAARVLVLNGGGDNPDDDAVQLADMIPGAVAVVAGSGDHGMACSDDDFQSALLTFLRQGWFSR